MATVLVQLESVRIIRTKKGDQMAFLNVTDGINKLDVTLFPETYFYHKDKLSEGGLFYLDGRTQERDGRIQLILSNMEEASTERFWILLENHDQDLDVSQILAKYPETSLSLFVIKEVRKPSLVKDIEYPRTRNLIRN